MNALYPSVAGLVSLAAIPTPTPIAIAGACCTATRSGQSCC